MVQLAHPPGVSGWELASRQPRHLACVCRICSTPAQAPTGAQECVLLVHGGGVLARGLGAANGLRDDLLLSIRVTTIEQDDKLQRHVRSDDSDERSRPPGICSPEAER